MEQPLRAYPDNPFSDQKASGLGVIRIGSYSRESEAIEYSSKTYKPDFTIPKADLAIDLKLSTAADHEKEFIAQINDDILAYKTKCGNLFFVVYDCGFIRDVDRFSGSFEAHDAVYVRVVKH
jgi:hypothetical protein